jgi:hypothetical protein
MGPSPVGQHGPRRGAALDEFRETHRAYFSTRERRIKEHIVIYWFQTGYKAAEIFRGTGYSLAFIHDTARRFAYRCLVRYVNGQYIGEPPRRRKKRKQQEEE